MDESVLGPVESLLMRSRLHVRCGRRRLRQGKVSLGIVTLEDAVSSAMQWYLARQDKENAEKAVHDDRTMFRMLVRSGVLDGRFDYDAFGALVEKALSDELESFDYTDVLKDIELLLTRLGVLPFDENMLPPEDPSTP